MENEDRRFIEARLLTPEAKIYLNILGVGPHIEAVKKVLHDWPHPDRVKMAIGLAGTKRYKLLLL